MMNNENGRSMVEMLGVLAIIGVLSVAGIAGYTMAMNKYRANEIVNAASQLVILAKAKNQGNGGTVSLSDINLGTVGGVSVMSADCTSTPCSVSVTWVDDDVKNVAKNMVTGSAYFDFAS